jgi:wobble nucleotide-excising tRNase
VFFLTHNFGFFREVRKWLKPRGTPKYSHSMYFISCPNTSGSRRASLAKLDRLLWEYDSEYQYLFKIVRDASQRDATDLAMLFHFPNVARRLLEAFLAFRMPDATGGLRTRLDQTALTLAQKERLVRFLDVRSHVDGIGIPEDDLSLLSITPDALRDVLLVIRQEDEPHFRRMVHLLDESVRH